MPNHHTPDQTAAAIELVGQTFPAATLAAVSDANRGRGIFSDVFAVSLEPPKAASTTPASVIVKIPTTTSNRAAAIASGAYRREAIAYRSLLDNLPIRFPRCYRVAEASDDTFSFVLEDLSALRFVDQIEGLDETDAIAVAGTLADLHRSWRLPPGRGRAIETGGIRHNTVGQLPADRIRDGLSCLDKRWDQHLSTEERRAFEQLVGQADHLTGAFEAVGDPVLCHGDPRADNLAFEAADTAKPGVVLFDWQQIAFQFGEADLAWLAATSLRPVDRRLADRQLVEAYGGDFDRYRLGFALPGLAVLLLAQRSFRTENEQRMAATSLHRIAQALIDLEVGHL